MASPPLALAKSPPHKSLAVAITRSSPRRSPPSWSELPLDLMQLVFERLGFADFERAKSVCSSWQSGSRKSKPNNQIPWLILFPKDKNHCLLFNPEDKEKLYKTQDLGNDFGKSSCLTTYKSWLLMRIRQEDFTYDLYILDLLTGKRINLPSGSYITSPILWIDEKTKNYLLIGKDGPYNVISLKNGDDTWKTIPELSTNSSLYQCLNMVYKDHKLYCINYYDLNIFDFSGETLLHVFSISVLECIDMEMGRAIRRNAHGLYNPPKVHKRHNIVITLRGDVLIVRSKLKIMSKIWKFKIYKMDSSKETKWERIFSLGDESIILDLGITVLAKDFEGITSNSIYFSSKDFEDEYKENKIFIYNLNTKKFEQPQPFVSSSITFSSARWFLPSF